MIYRTGMPRRRGSIGVGLLIAAIALLSYCSTSEVNQITGRTQYLSLSTEEGIALGLQTAPTMAQQFGGESADRSARARTATIGNNLVRANREDLAQRKFDFHLLADRDTINAFALPGGQIFITEGLYRRLTSDDQLAGVLAHEIGHVAGRHGSEQMAKQQLSQGLSSAAVVATGDTSSGYIASMAGQFINLRYGRGDELESDALALRFMSRAGYQPEAMLQVLAILAKASGGLGEGPDFMSTHPNSQQRMAELREKLEANRY